MNFRGTTMGLLVLFLGAALARGSGPDRFQVASKPIETKHIPWARPLPDGPIRALCLVPIPSQRDIIELAQRMDLKYDLVAFQHPLMDRDAAKGFRELLDGGAYDVVILSKVKLELLPSEVQDLLVKKVAGGMGIVSVDSQATPKTSALIQVGDSGDFLEVALPLSLLPEKCRPEVKVGEWEQGRSVRLSYKARATCLTPEVKHEQVHYRDWETYFQLLARAVMWAGKRQAGVHVESVTPEGGQLPRKHVPSEIIFRVTSAADMDAVATALFHGIDYYEAIETREKRVSLKKGRETEIKFPLLDFRAGKHHAVDLILRDAGGCSRAFATATYQIISPVALRSLECEKAFYRHGDEAVMIATIENQSQPRDAEYVITLADMHGRKIAKQSRPMAIPGGRSEHRFILPTGKSLTTLNRARLLIRDARGPLLEEDACILLPETKPVWDDYLVSTSQFSDRNAYLRPYYTQIARDIGIEGLVIPLRYTREALEQAVPVMYWGAAKVRAFGYNFHGEETSTARKPCLSDPATREKIARSYEELGAELRRYGPVAIASLEDESELSGARYCNLEVCTSEYCTKRYHDWLQKQYQTVDALNAQWSTAYQSFDEIRQITYQEARKLDNPAQWVDWRTFMEHVWLDALLLTRKGVKKNYPEVRMGFSNSFGQMPFSGWNYETLSHHVDMSIEYPTILDRIRPPKEKDPFEEDTVAMSHVIRQKLDIRKSFMCDDCPIPGWIWYDRSEQGAEFKPWWMAFMEAGGCTPWGPASLSVLRDAKSMSFWAFVHPSLAHTKSSKWLASGIRDLTRGVGKIFVDYHKARPQVAVLYSQPSMHLAWAWSDVEKAFEPETDSLYAWYYKSRVNITRLLRELGCAYRYVGSAQIDSGEMEHYRVLFLPCSLCLSDQTLEGIQQFVAKGGVVVADIGVGAADQRGKPLAHRKEVENLFAISREAVGRKIEPARLAIAGAEGVDIPENLKLAGMDNIVPRALAAATRENGAPAMVQNSMGEGKAVYLNGFLGYSMPSRLMMRNLLALAGVGSPIRVTSGGREQLGYEIANFQRKNVEILGILRLREEANPTEVKLAEKKHLYDVRGKKYVGLADTARFDLTRKAAAVLAVMPYKIIGMEASVSPQKCKQGGTIRVASKVLSGEAAPGDHVLRMEVYDPSGQLTRAYTDNVLANAGRFDRTIPLALNDPPGQWRILLTDVISGKRAEATFELLP